MNLGGKDLVNRVKSLLEIGCFLGVQLKEDVENWIDKCFSAYDLEMKHDKQIKKIKSSAWQ